jgi:hypothetical protein
MMTMADLENAFPETDPEGRRRSQEILEELEGKLAQFLSWHGIDIDRAREYIRLARDDSKTADEHAKDFFTPAEQAKLPGLR